MSCVQTLNGIQYDCETSMGGLKAVYIANASEIAQVSVDSTTEEGQDIIDAIILTTPDSRPFRKYTFRRNTASMTSTLNVDPANGVSISTDVSLSFLRQDTRKRFEISALSLGELVVIVEDANGSFWYLGKDIPVMASAGGAESGTTFTDGNRYTITLQDNSKDYPYEIRTQAGTSGQAYVDIESLLPES